jgi:transcriptional regulator with XRE-family HTH domain
MLRSNVAPALRHLRRRRRWRQADLAAMSGSSRGAVSRIERGGLRGVPVGVIERLAEALDASIELTVRWQGEQMDRLIDAGHARLQEQAAALLASNGWLVRSEVSFNHFGDRGRVDVLAFHPSARTLIVVEVKTAIGDLQETLGRIEVKARLGATLAAAAGWNLPQDVVPALVIADRRAARRTVAQHETLFTRYSIRGRAAVAWIRHPRPPAPNGLLWFASLPNSHGASVTGGRRVRTVT